jgi:phosphatidylglycerophosphate synthase
MASGVCAFHVLFSVNDSFFHERGSPRPMLKWLPNALTALRILLLPVLVVLMAGVAEGRVERPALVGLFLAMAVTDWLDGYLARRLQATTRWGSMADALADRLLMLVPLLYVAISGPASFPPVPLWVPLWLLALDVAISAAWLVARRRYGAQRPAIHNLPGRAGVWLLFGLVLWVLTGLPAAGVVPLALAGLALVTLSATLYLRRWIAA